MGTHDLEDDLDTDWFAAALPECDLLDLLAPLTGAALPGVGDDVAGAVLPDEPMEREPTSEERIAILRATIRKLQMELQMQLLNCGQQQTGALIQEDQDLKFEENFKVEKMESSPSLQPVFSDNQWPRETAGVKHESSPRVGKRCRSFEGPAA